jgi:hypothetical protein
MVPLLLLSLFGAFLRGQVLVNASPSDEMQKFIDECYVMIETMEHCAEGWVQFEQEIIDSIDSFSERIVYTQSLIMEEADLIIDMAERIVETEAIMIDLIESCNCSDHTETPKTLKLTPPLQVSQPVSSVVRVPFNFSPNSSLAVMEHCSAMDYAIEVMDACISTFEVYNDDFLEVLSYMVPVPCPPSAHPIARTLQSKTWGTEL